MKLRIMAIMYIHVHWNKSEDHHDEGPDHVGDDEDQDDVRGDKN